MKITTTELKKILREAIEQVLKETEYYDVLQGEMPPPQSMGAGPVNTEVEAENALMAAVDALATAGYSHDEIVTLVTDMEAGGEQEPEEVETEEDIEAIHLPNPMKQKDPRYRNRLTADQWINRVKGRLKGDRSPGDFRENKG